VLSYSHLICLTCALSSASSSSLRRRWSACLAAASLPAPRHTQVGAATKLLTNWAWIRTLPVPKITHKYSTDNGPKKGLTLWWKRSCCKANPKQYLQRQPWAGEPERVASRARLPPRPRPRRRHRQRRGCRPSCARGPSSRSYTRVKRGVRWNPRWSLEGVKMEP
jgi:hypothetical protein